MTAVPPDAPASLEQLVADQLPVLPVLSFQLTETMQQIEQAVVAVCGNFDAIAARSRASVEKTAQFLGISAESEAESIEIPLNAARNTLGLLLDRLGRACTQSEAAMQRLESVARCSQQIEKALETLDQIALGNRLLAVNARIEAAHIGSQAAGFNVVADEILAQSRRSAAIVQAVLATRQELNRATASAMESLRATAAEDRQALDTSRQEVSRTLDQFAGTVDAMRSALDQLAQEGEQLSGDISGAVRGLQFQDRTSQRARHVIEALEIMHARLQAAVPVRQPGTSEALRELSSRYTMAEEAQRDAGVESGEVELF